MLFAGMLSYPVADVLCFGCSAQVSAEVGTYRFHSLYSCNQKRVVFGNLLRLLPDRWRLFVCLFWIRNRMCPTGSTHKGGPTHSKMSYQMIYFLLYFFCIMYYFKYKKIFFLYLQFSLICVVYLICILALVFFPSVYIIFIHYSLLTVCVLNKLNPTSVKCFYVKKLRPQNKIWYKCS